MQTVSRQQIVNMFPRQRKAQSNTVTTEISLLINSYFTFNSLHVHAVTGAGELGDWLCTK
jgi:hypothetical protein